MRFAMSFGFPLRLKESSNGFELSLQQITKQSERLRLWAKHPSMPGCTVSSADKIQSRMALMVAAD